MLEAYRFLLNKYVPGDQVILYLSMYADGTWGTDPYAKFEGINQGNVPTIQPGNEEHINTDQIPIYAVVARSSPVDKIQSMSTWNDWLKSGSPPGIQHMVCFDYEHGFRSCHTTYDLDGTVLSRELRFSSDDLDCELLMDATKHVLYYRQHLLPEWDKYQPTWTCVLNSSHKAPDILCLESVQPAGMHYHELLRYEGLPGLKGDGSMLVWRSRRK
ncbi:unnamed protein product [Rhizoctonia solani]|uniref:Uncharacterized protein n=1 Tax=Rhizoctonia solani TaxID=456999 RepID=A0A8H3E1E4_9AGAM|nr:unnamed protein product [Rhizoctonia solani]